MLNMNISAPNINASTAEAGIFSAHCDRYWGAGLPAIPLKPYTPNGGKGGKPTGKEPALPSWQEMQSRMPTDAERIGWKMYHANGNIGLPLGPESGLIAIDVDTDDPVVLGIVQRILPPSPWKRIGKKGFVQVYRWSGDLATFRIKYRDAAGKLQSLVEMLADGTQIVLPPSIHPDIVKPYVANRDLVDCLGEMEPLPSDIEKQLRKALAEAGFNVGANADLKPLAGTGGVGEGGRNDTLFREGARLRGENFSIEVIEAHLLTVNRDRCDPPLSDEEVRTIAASVMRYEANRWYDLNDIGNAERFIRDHAAHVRYVPDKGIWRFWTGTHWADDPGNLNMMRFARETVEGIKVDADAATKVEVQKGLSRHARNSGDRARLRAMFDVAASMPGMSALSTEFDLLPNLLVVANGVIDLRTGELLPHDPARLTTKCLPTAYRPGTKAPTFKAFLERVLPDPAVSNFLQLFQGSALQGERAEQLMVVLHGRGRNGKSVYADLMVEMLGGYAVETSASTFVADDKRSPNAARSDLVRLAPARSVYAAETPDKRRLDGTVIKRLTGDAQLPCRALYAEETSFPIGFNIFLLCNPWPNVDESDDALWTRFVRLPFNVVIPSAEQIKNLHKVIMATEAEGVLCWLVEGAVAYAQHGLMIPPVLTKATADWRKRIGTVERYMRGNVERAEGGSLSLRWLHAEYVLELQRVRGNPIGEESFRTRLESLGYSIVDGDYGEMVEDVNTISAVTKERASVKKAAA